MFYASWDACIPHTALWVSHAELGRLRNYRRGTALYRQGERHGYFHLIRAGYIQADMVHPDGRTLTLELMGPGTIFGEGAAFDNGLRYVNARCVTDVTVTSYLPDDVLSSSGGMELMASLVRIMSGKQRLLASKLLQFCGDDPGSRVRQLLLRLTAVQQRAAAIRIGEPIVLHFSQEQLGEMCGLSRVSVSRALKRLSQDGALTTHVKQIEIVDVVALQD